MAAHSGIGQKEGLDLRQGPVARFREKNEYGNVKSVMA